MKFCICNVDGPREYYTSEISQKKTNTLCYPLYVDSKKSKQTNVHNNRNGFTGIENKLMVAHGKSEGVGGNTGVWD